jgi:uncharacterized membrane protein
MTRPAYWIFAVLSLLIAVSSLRGLIAPLSLVMPNMAHFLTEAPWRLWGHILGGPLALALAPLQLSVWLRQRWPRVHRWSGRLYAAAVLIAGLAGMTLAPTSDASNFARIGFFVLGVLWLVTTFMGIALAMRGDLSRHRWWMERSIALTFAAVTLRLIMGPLMASGWSVAQTYDITAWGSWVLNLAILEIWQRKRKTAPEGAA